jgi:hypothetical protein
MLMLLTHKQQTIRTFLAFDFLVVANDVNLCSPGVISDTFYRSMNVTTENGQEHCTNTVPDLVVVMMMMMMMMMNKNDTTLIPSD